MTEPLADRLTAAITAGNTSAVRGIMAGTTPDQHKELRAAWEQLRGMATDPDPGSAVTYPRQQAWLVAATAMAPTAAAVAKVLRRSECDDLEDVPFLGVLTDRQVPWLPELLDLLTDDKAFRSAYEHLVEAIRQHLGTGYPRSARYLARLCQTYAWKKRPLLDHLRDDKDMLDVLPDLLDVADIGTITDLTPQKVRVGRWPDQHEIDNPPENRWDGSIVALTREGVFERDAILDQVLRVLLRGGNRNHVAYFLRLLEQFAPTDAEVVRRLGSYTQLVSTGSGVVAKAAYQAIRAAHEAGAVETVDVLALSPGVLARSEIGLVTAHLTWLGSLLAGNPELAGDIARATLTAVEHPKLSVQERALAQLEKLGSLPDDVRDTLTTLVDHVPQAIRPRATALAGSAEHVAQVEAPPAPLPPAPLPPSAAMPPVPTTPADIAHVVSALLESGDEVLGEQALAAFPAALPGSMTAEADAEVHAALASMADRIREQVEAHLINESTPPWAPLLFHHAGLGLTNREADGKLRVLWGDTVHGPYARMVGTGPTALLRARVADAISRRGSQLVAYPSTVDGRIDPGDVVRRLAALGHVGQSSPALQQAWLRLPREVDPAVVAELERLGTRAATWLAARLKAGPMPDPEVVLSVENVYCGSLETQRRLLVRLRPATDTTGTELGDLALTLPNPQRAAADEMGWQPSVTGFAGVLLALPHHREVVAAATVPLACAMSGRLGDDTRRVVTGLPGAAGPTGQATALVIAYAALSPNATDRTAAADALLGFVATGDLDSAVFGDVLLRLFELNVVTVNRLTGVLAEVVRSGPAGAEFAWRSVTRFLPAVLADPPRGIPELLETCTDAVLRCHVRDRIPELDALADRKGTNRTTAEARRLREALTRP